MLPCRGSRKRALQCHQTAAIENHRSAAQMHGGGGKRTSAGLQLCIHGLQTCFTRAVHVHGKGASHATTGLQLCIADALCMCMTPPALPTVAGEVRVPNPSHPTYRHSQNNTTEGRRKRMMGKRGAACYPETAEARGPGSPYYTALREVKGSRESSE